MRRWGWLPALGTPLILLGGSILAQRSQPVGDHYSAVRNTLSALAAQDATDRWIMTATLFLVGVGYVASAAALAEARPLGRVLLAGGGAATMGVSLMAQPNLAHVPTAAVAFVLLAGWPVASRVPSAMVGGVVTVVLAGLLIWFGWQLEGPWLGLTERLVAGSEAIWPALAIVLSHRSHPVTSSAHPARR